MEIKCQFNLVRWTNPPTKNPIYVCVVTEANIILPGTKIKKFSGVHKPGRSDKDVEAIQFQSLVVHYMPRGIGLFFPKLKCLEVLNCGLKVITRSDLIGLENLSTLMLCRNEIQSLPSNLFKLTKKLQNVSFANNKLECMSAKLLEPLAHNKILLLDFEKNTAIDMKFTDQPIGYPSPSHVSGYSFGANNVSTVSTLANVIKSISERCRIPLADEPQLGSANFLEKMRDKCKQLFETGELSDFVIKITDGDEFRVHKFVLAMQSPVFKAVFMNKMQEEQSNSMTIDGFGSMAIAEFLLYLYAGEVPDETNAMELFALSAKYDVPVLKDICEEMVLQNMVLFSSDNLKMLSFTEIKRIFIDTDLSNDLLDHPEKVQELMESKRDYDQKLKLAKEELDMTLNKLKIATI